MAAGQIDAGAALVRTKERLTALAPFAAPARRLPQKDADAITDPATADSRPQRDDVSSRFMTGSALTGMQIIEANPTCANADQHLAGAGLGHGCGLSLPRPVLQYANRTHLPAGRMGAAHIKPHRRAGA
jgi:hypothetical protein